MEPSEHLQMTKTSYLTLRNGSILGAVAAAIGTLGVQFLAMAFGHGENLIGFLLIPVWRAMLSPALCVSRLLGWSWQIGSFYEYPRKLFYLALLVNVVLGMLFGIIGATTMNALRKPNL